VGHVRAVGDWLVDFWGLQCQVTVVVVEVVGSIGYALLMVVDDEGCH
jgi:hypothetical protein